MMPETLTTARMTLRRPVLSDLDGYVAYYTGARAGGVGGPKPRYVVVERFMGMVGQWMLRGYGRHVMVDADGAFGHVGVMHIDDVDPPEITWTLWDPAREGRGFATEAARAVLAAWNGPALVARIMPENAGSISVAKRLGMVEDQNATPPSYNGEVLTFRMPEAQG